MTEKHQLASELVHAIQDMIDTYGDYHIWYEYDNELLNGLDVVFCKDANPKWLKLMNMDDFFFVMQESET